jgi:hypothetical protein
MIANTAASPLDESHGATSEEKIRENAMVGNQSHAGLIVAVVEVIRALAWPIGFLVVLYWFKCEVRQFLKAVGTFISNRTIKATYGSASVEIGGVAQEQLDAAVQEQLRTIQQEVPAPLPTVERSKIPDLVEARRFILRDDAGQARAELGFLLKGETRYPVIRLLDSRAKPILTLLANDEGYAGMLAVQPTAGALILMIDPEDGPIIQMEEVAKDYHAKFKPDSLSIANRRVLLSAPKGAPSTITLRDLDGRQIVVAP